MVAGILRPQLPWADGTPALTILLAPGESIDEPVEHIIGIRHGSFNSRFRVRIRQCASGAHLGLRRRRRRQSMQPDRALQDLRGSDFPNRKGRRDQRAGSRRLRRGHHHQVDHHQRNERPGLRLDPCLAGPGRDHRHHRSGRCQADRAAHRARYQRGGHRAQRRAHSGRQPCRDLGGHREQQDRRVHRQRHPR